MQRPEKRRQEDAMADKIRLGIVGANPDQGSWGARAHIPALKLLPEFDLKAICTAHAETAQAAKQAFGSELAFHHYNEMFAHPDIDLVTVTVRVPYHHEIVMAALKAGKNVFCEWPLGANVSQAEDMTNLAHEKSLFNMVGLQGRSDSHLRYVRQLIADGYVGDVVAVNMTAFSGGGGGPELTPDRVWRTDRKAGANTLTIAGGHSIDALCFCAGEFAEVSAKITTQSPKATVKGGGEVDITSPDNVLLSGVLENGAVASVHVAAVPSNGSGWRMEIYGRDGTLSLASGQAQMGPHRLAGAQKGEQMAELPLPDTYVLAPEGMPKGQAYNVGQAYIRLADAFNGRSSVDPDFSVALRRHRLIEAMERSSDEGRSVRLN
jgi:predicted dehydrogenase